MNIKKKISLKDVGNAISSPFKKVNKALKKRKIRKAMKTIDNNSQLAAEMVGEQINDMVLEGFEPWKE